MLERVVIEDEVVRKRREDEVYNESEDPMGETWLAHSSAPEAVLENKPCDEKEGQRLSIQVISRPDTHVGRLGGLDGEVDCRGLIHPRRQTASRNRRRVACGIAEQVVGRRARREQCSIQVVKGKSVDEL